MTVATMDRPAAPKPVSNGPVQIIEDLGLTAAVDLPAMVSRKCAFKPVHMGESDLPIGALLDVIRKHDSLCPPRTGHVGNWGNIARGRSGAMDFNKAVCAPGHGYPLLYCFTQTEAVLSQHGDWGYLPGSLVERDVRTPLQLHAWNGAAFAPCTHAQPRFTPFVQAKIDGELRPLTELHRERLPALGPVPFRLEQAIFAERSETVRPLLSVLFEDARRRENPRRALQDLVSHAVARDGALTRCDLQCDGSGYRLGDSVFASTEVLVENVMEPFRAVAQPRQFMADLKDLPPHLPVASNLLIAIVSAVLETHYPGGRPAGHARAPINPHLHWGGRDMAGCPPYRRGYLFEDTKIRSMKRICATLTANFSDVAPLCFVLLPAAIFMLCPTDVHAGDAERLAILFRQIREGAAGDVQAIETVTQTWHDTHGARMSPYFRDRFGPRRGGLLAGDLPDASEPVEPDGFRDLTLKQASTIVGALYDIAANQRTQP